LEQFILGGSPIFLGIPAIQQYAIGAIMAHRKTLDPSEFCAIRTYLRLTQAQMAEFLDIHPMTVSSWETGRVRIPLNVSMLMILLETGEATVENLEARTMNRQVAV
jgi:DNA-binding transcriptional regulator YiaG